MTGGAIQPRLPTAPRAGVCRFCGRTFALASAAGFWWLDDHQTTCSADPCVERYVTEFAAILRRLHDNQAHQGRDVYA